MNHLERPKIVLFSKIENIIIEIDEKYKKAILIDHF